MRNGNIGTHADGRSREGPDQSRSGVPGNYFDHGAARTRLKREIAKDKKEVAASETTSSSSFDSWYLNSARSSLFVHKMAVPSLRCRPFRHRGNARVTKGIARETARVISLHPSHWLSA